MSSITHIEQQLAAMRAQQALPTPDIMNQIKELIQTTISNELGIIKKSLTDQITPPKKERTILEAIGLTLTQEEQTWLSKPEVLKYIPYFLTEKEGGRLY